MKKNAYNPEHVAFAKQCSAGGVTKDNIAVFLNRQFHTDYLAKDVEEMLSAPSPESNNSRAVEIAAGFVFNPQKRRRFLVGLLTAIVLIVTALTLLGIFVSWIPAIVVASTAALAALALVITVLVLIKSGWADRNL